MDINGKIALVLGAVKGIGKAIAMALGKKGAILVLTRHDWENFFVEMEKDFASINAQYTIVDVDLCDVDQVESLAEFIKLEYGHLDILVNNVERGGWPVVHGSYISEQWDMEIKTTLKAKQWVFSSMLPLLKEASSACVINISSIAGIIGRSGPGALIFNDGYAAANRGISSLTETWARIGAPDIRVNELMIGICDTRHGKQTRGWDQVLTSTEQQQILDHILLKRTGTPEDVVKACLFIIEQASYMTGSIIRLDGGFVLGGEKVPPMPKGVL